MNPSYLTTYLNDITKQIVAMKYLLYKTGYHSSTTLKRNISTIKELNDNKEEVTNYMNDEKENYSNWSNEIKKEFLIFREEKYNQMKLLEEIYVANLKVRNLAEFMNEKAKEYNTKSIRWGFVTLGVFVALILLFGLIISPEIS